MYIGVSKGGVGVGAAFPSGSWLPSLNRGLTNKIASDAAKKPTKKFSLHSTFTEQRTYDDKHKNNKPNDKFCLLSLPTPYSNGVIIFIDRLVIA